MKLLVDMNLSPRWGEFFQSHALEAQHWSEVGSCNAPDQEIMSFAAANGYVVITHDLDFSAILAATNDTKPSVIQVRARDISPEAIGARVIELPPVPWTLG